jgi:hypothetical protein
VTGDPARGPAPYGVDAEFMPFQQHELGIHAKSPVLMVPA